MNWPFAAAMISTMVLATISYVATLRAHLRLRVEERMVQLETDLVRLRASVVALNASPQVEAAIARAWDAVATRLGEDPS